MAEKRRPRRTLGHIWRRGRAMVRDEGWRRLLFVVLADLGYRRFLLYEGWLDEPIVPVPARRPVSGRSCASSTSASARGVGTVIARGTRVAGRAPARTDAAASLRA